MATASFNYLQRRKIKRTKHFNINREEDPSDDMAVSVRLDNSLLSFIEEKEIIRLEASARGTYFAIDLEKSENAQKVEITGINKKDNPSFRIYTILDVDRSRIRRASADFKLNSGKRRNKNRIKKQIPAKREGFFNFAFADINSSIYQLSWDNGLEITVSERLQNILDHEIQKNASFRAAFLPSLVKEILLGIIIRNVNKDELGETESYWIKWANELNLFNDDQEYPDNGFKEDSGDLNQEWLDWCDTTYSNFCSGEHFEGLNYLEAMVRKHGN